MILLMTLASIIICNTSANLAAYESIDVVFTEEEAEMYRQWAAEAEEWRSRNEGSTDYYYEDPVFTEIASYGDPAGSEVLLLVSEGYFDGVGQRHMELWIRDILNDDADEVMVVETNFCSPENIRAYLLSRYNNSNLIGVILFGNIPSATVQFGDTFNHIPYPYISWDYFYSDLDGMWEDNVTGMVSWEDWPWYPPGDGRYDDFSGDLGPEIYCGRIMTGWIGNNPGYEVSISRDYIDKVHEWRMLQPPSIYNAMVYVDEWISSSEANVLKASVARAFSPTVLRHDNNTEDVDYRNNCLLDGNVLTMMSCHSNQSGHYWEQSGVPYNITTIEKLELTQTYSSFHFLITCSTLSLGNPVSIANWYTQYSSNGIATFACTKSMYGNTGLNYLLNELFDGIDNGQSIGDGYSAFFSAAANGGFSEEDKMNIFGVCLIGDPTVVPIP